MMATFYDGALGHPAAVRTLADLFVMENDVIEKLSAWGLSGADIWNAYDLCGRNIATLATKVRARNAPLLTAVKAKR